MSMTKGIAMVTSPLSVAETTDRLTTVMKNKGIRIYDLIDQQAELAQAGITIPPMQFILFGNPKAGGQVLSSVPLAGLDLPLKILVWEDQYHRVKVAYNEADHLKERYELGPELARLLDLSQLISAALTG